MQTCIVNGNQGDLDRAEEHHRQALAIHREIGHRPGEADQLGIDTVIGACVHDIGTLRVNRQSPDLGFPREIPTTAPAISAVGASK